MAYIINTFSPGTEVKVINKTAAQWTAQNPRLSAFELGVETDTGKAKLGDGTTLWGSLSYWAPNSGDAAGATNTVYRGSYMLITDIV